MQGPCGRLLGRSLLSSARHAQGAVPSAAAVLGGAPRWLTTSGANCAPDVTVPSMGESIKEGSIASVLKQVGCVYCR
jgi:hypothetical protein